VTDTPEEVTEVEDTETVVEETEVDAPPWTEPTEQPEPEPQADKPNALNAIINNPMWLALLFLTVIVLTLVILA
jgi:hypothetical protein